jgi:hypothetical protein
LAKATLATARDSDSVDALQNSLVSKAMRHKDGSKKPIRAQGATGISPTL